ncbi:MAG: tol-pal system protein YbgF [Pseudomonadota bacterium]
MLLFVFSFTFFDDAYAQTQPQKKQSSQQNKNLETRVKALEQKLADIQIMLATFESLIRKQIGQSAQVSSTGATGTNTAPSFSQNEEKSETNNPFTQQGPKNTQTVVVKSKVDDERMEGVETQIRAMSSQISQLTQQVQGLTSSTQMISRQTGSASSPRHPTTIVKRDFPQTVAALPDPGQTKIERSAEQLYDKAYGHLLKQDYEAAEQAFMAFLKRHGKDQLAGNAQYWLGETYFIRGKYKKAADRFLKSYTNFKKGQKAPDSLLKLALSLRKLGRKDAACTTFIELGKKFPEAPGHVKQRARSERKNMGCS